MKERNSKAFMFANSNHRQFQKGLDADKARASRRDVQLSLRRKTREAHLQKKKRMLSQRAPAHLSSNGIVGSQEIVPSIQEIPKLIAKVMNTDSLNTQLEGVRGVRLLLSMEREPPTLRIMRSGAVPKIINFMFTDEKDKECRSQQSDIKKKIQFEAAWAITNICAGTSHCTTTMVKLGAIKAFVDLLRNAESPEMAEQAVWGLGNILGEGKKFKDEILSSGVIKDFVQIINDSSNVKTVVLTNAMWALSNFCRCAKLELAQISFLIPAITKLLRETKCDALIPDSLWCLAYISQQNDQIINSLAKSSAVTIAMKYLHQESAKYEVALQQVSNQRTLAKKQQVRNTTKEAMLKMNYKIYNPCLRMLANLVTGEDSVTQRVLEAGYLDVIYPFMSHFCTKLRKEVMWSLSNILAGTHQQIEAVLSRPKIFQALMNSAKSDVYSVQLEACYGICNMTQDCISSQKKKLVEFGAIEALVGLLKNKHLNERAMQVILEGLEAFLSIYGERNDDRSFNPYADRVEECGGLDVLEDKMSDHNLSEAVYCLLANILQKYWICEENTDGLCADNKVQQYLKAAVDTNTNQFKFGCGSAAQATNSNPLQTNVAIRGGGSTPNERFAF